VGGKRVVRERVNTMGAKSIEHMRQNYNTELFICHRALIFCFVGLHRFYTFDLAPKIYLVLKFKYGLKKKI
jgi:hypothetical protein